MRCLVAGAGGFVGANLCERLAGDGHEVHGIVRSASRATRLHPIAGCMTVHETDLVSPNLSKLVGRIRPDIVYNAAGCGATPGAADALIRGNLVALANLLRACESSPPSRVVHLGSSSEYGPRTLGAMAEGDTPAPATAYGLVKLAQTLLCQDWSRNTGIGVTVLRPFSIYGPLESASRLVPRLLQSAASGTRLNMGNPEQPHDFVYVGDVVDLLADTDKMQTAPDVVNVGTGRETTLRQIVKLVEKVTGKILKVQWNAYPASDGDSPAWMADTTRLETLAGKPLPTDIEAGLRKTWEQTDLNGR